MDGPSFNNLRECAYELAAFHHHEAAKALRAYARGELIDVEPHAAQYMRRRHPMVLIGAHVLFRAAGDPRTLKLQGAVLEGQDEIFRDFIDRTIDRYARQLRIRGSQVAELPSPRVIAATFVCLDMRSDSVQAFFAHHHAVTKEWAASLNQRVLALKVKAVPPLRIIHGQSGSQPPSP